MTAFSTDDADFRQFASFDRPLQPPSSLVDAITSSTSNGLPGSLSVVEPIALSASPAPSFTPPPPARTAWLLPPPLRIAAAVLICVSLIGSFFVLNRPGGHDASNNLAFRPSSELRDDVNNAGNAGGSWVVGDTNPEMAIAVELGSVTGDRVGFDPTRVRGIITGDSYIYPTFSNGRGALHRSDLGGTALVWTVTIQALSNIVSDGTLVYLVSTEGNAGTSPAMLTAISLDSGAVAWQIASFDSTFEASTSLVIAGGSLYVANTAGEVMALSTRDGAMLSKVELEKPEMPAPELLERTPAAPFMALGDAGLFVVKSDQSVVRLDPLSGEEAGSIDVPGAVASSSILTIPQVRGSTLALLIGHLDEGEGNATPITVLTADTSSLAIEDEIDFHDLRGGNIVLTDDAVYVPVADAATSPAGIAKIDLATGNVSQPFGDVTSQALLFLSVSGDTLMVASSDSRSVRFVERHMGDLITTVETDFRFANGGFFFQPIQLWHNQPIAIDSLGGVHLIVTDPASVPSSTPVVVAQS